VKPHKVFPLLYLDYRCNPFEKISRLASLLVTSPSDVGTNRMQAKNRGLFFGDDHGCVGCHVPRINLFFHYYVPVLQEIKTTANKTEKRMKTIVKHYVLCQCCSKATAYLTM